MREAIGIAGVARSGKDSVGKVIAAMLRCNKINAQRFAFADCLKEDLRTLFRDQFDIDPFTRSNEEKNIIRPILVAYGCAWRAVDPLHWVSKLEQLEKGIFPVVTDVRFPNEAKAIQDAGGIVMHIARQDENGNFIPPPNPEETLNDPLVSAIADLHLSLPCFNLEDEDDNDTFCQVVELALADSIISKIGAWKKSYPLRSKKSNKCKTTST